MLFKNINSICLQIITILVFNVWDISLCSNIDIEKLNQDKPVTMVIAIARHGWRTAGEARYPNDPLKDRQDELWPEGLMELTNRGKMDQYKLGMWLGERYKSLLNEGYTSKSVYALSTNTDRSSMSAMCLMTGLFPPSDKKIWNQQLLWQPIPVHSYDVTAGNLLNTYSHVDCPRYWFEFEKMKQSAEYKQLIDTYRDLRDFIYNSTSANLTDFKQFDYLYDYIESQTYQNVTIPDWAQKIYPEPWRSASLNYFIMPTFNEPLKRLFMGPLLKEISQQFNGKRAGENLRKFYLLSGHDDNVSNFLNFFGTFNWILPPFSSVILLELRKNSNNDYFVTIFYKNSTGEPYLMRADKCQHVCPLETFNSIIAPYIPQDWNNECKITSSAVVHKGGQIILSLVLVLFILRI